jgi:hypothetical protein
MKKESPGKGIEGKVGEQIQLLRHSTGGREGMSQNTEHAIAAFC